MENNYLFLNVSTNFHILDGRKLLISYILITSV